MKASVLYNINDLRYTDIPIPELKNDEVLINVKACGICGSDVNRVFKTGTYHFPTVIGHEFSGVVVKSPNYPHLLGKRVGIFPLKPCFQCEACKEENYEMCANYDYLGSRCDGGFEEYVAVPAWNVIELPENITFEEAAMLEPTSVAIHALKRLGDIQGKIIAIIGPGPIGNILAKIAKLNGAQSVIMIGRTQSKLDFSKIYGADIIINSSTQNVIDTIYEITDNLGVDAVVEGTGAKQSLSYGIEIVRNGGSIIILGNPLGDVEISKSVYWKILRKQLTIMGTWNSSFGNKKNDWSDAISLLKSGRLDLNPLISHKLEFDSLQNGLEMMRTSSILTNKIILINNESTR